jgi:hypothetical protein
LIGSLHSRLETALMLTGQMPEVEITERLDSHPTAAVVLGRYLNQKTAVQRYAAMALVKGKPGMVEVLVTECDTEAAGRELIHKAIEPYL